MKTPIRFGIIGTGAIATQHARAIAAVPDAELVAVWGHDPRQSRIFASEHQAEAVLHSESLTERDDIDAITIATPSGSHAAFAIPPLTRGKAVLCEKPLEITLDKIDAILEAAHNHQAPLAAVLQLRLGRGAQAIKYALEQGRFGKLCHCGVSIKWWRNQAYYDAVDWRGTRALDGGGALMNQGIHGVDLLQWLAGMPAEVFAFSGCRSHERIEVEDCITVALRFPNGALGSIEASTACYPGSAMRIEIHGDQGTAVLEDDQLLRWEFAHPLPGDDRIRSARAGDFVGGSRNPADIGIEGHRLLIADLVDALQNRRPPLIPGTEARNAVHLILSAYKSAHSGKSVLLNF